jgi:ATP-dependent Clp protease ATP-binding subunit ClpA
VLTADQLRDKARGMRDEAAAIRATLEHQSPMRRAGLRARVERMERLAQELERAAQRAEATGQ